MSDGRDFTLTRNQIVSLLQELGEELAQQGLKAQLFVVGGAAMALAFNTRRTTSDVDGIFEPKAVVYEAARRIAERHEGMPSDWLNDGVKGLLPGQDPEAKVILEAPGVSVSVPSARYLLALKVQAARFDRDTDDIRFLARECGVQTSDEVLSIAEDVIGTSRLLPKAQFIVQEMFPPVKPSLSFRFNTWRQKPRGRAAKRSPKPTRSPAQPKQLRCGGYTKEGRRCILWAGHGGHHRGRW